MGVSHLQPNMNHLPLLLLLVCSCHGLVPDPSWLKFCGELESPSLPQEDLSDDRARRLESPDQPSSPQEDQSDDRAGRLESPDQSSSPQEDLSDDRAGRLESPDKPSSSQEDQSDDRAGRLESPVQPILSQEDKSDDIAHRLESSDQPSSSQEDQSDDRARRSLSLSHDEGTLQRFRRFVIPESMKVEFNPTCSDIDCLIQRALGFGFLGLGAVIALWTVLNNSDEEHLSRRRRRRDAEFQNKCAFLLLEEDLIFTSISCLPKVLKTGMTISGQNYSIDNVNIVKDDNTALVKLGSRVKEGLLDCHMSPMSFHYK